VVGQGGDGLQSCRSESRWLDLAGGKNVVWRVYSKTVYFIKSKGQKMTCPWWESLLLSHVKWHLFDFVELENVGTKWV
jgi:hypothetical protein